MRFLQVGLGRGLPAIGAIFFNLYVAGKLSIGDADVFFIWFTVLYVLSFIGKLGFDIYVLRDLGSSELPSAAGCKRAAFLSSVVLTLAGLFWAPSELRWLLYSLPAFCVAGINSSVLRATGRETLGGFLEVSLLSSAAFVVLFFLEFLGKSLTLEVVSYGFFGAAFFVFMIGEILVGRFHSVVGTSKVYFWNVVSGLKLIPSPLMIYMTQWVAILFLGVAGLGAVSIYSVALRLASGFAFVAITIDAFVAPRFAKYLREGDRDGVNSLIKAVRKKAFFFLGGGLLVYVLMGRYLVMFFLGGEYVEAFYVSIVLALSYCFIIFIGPYQFFLLMGGEERKVNLCNFISLFLVVLGCFILWFFSIDFVWAYALIVSASRVVGVSLMHCFSLRIMSRG